MGVDKDTVDVTWYQHWICGVLMRWKRIWKRIATPARLLTAMRRDWLISVSFHRSDSTPSAMNATCQPIRDCLAFSPNA